MYVDVSALVSASLIRESIDIRLYVELIKMWEIAYEPQPCAFALFFVMYPTEPLK